MEPVRRGINGFGCVKRAVTGTLALLLAFLAPSAPAATFNSETFIAAGDTTYDGQDIIVDATTLTIDGTHNFASLTLKNNAVLTHSVEPAELLALYVNEVDIKGGSKIDVSGKGRPGNLLVSETSGGSYGGPGGTDGGITNTTYGDYSLPGELGTGGWGSYGGGAVKIIAGALRLDGEVLAQGSGASIDNFTGGGSGGSIWLDAGTLSGSGSVRADGGSTLVVLDYGFGYAGGGGGGGRVAVFYDELDPLAPFDLSGIYARGGKGTVYGGPGTVYTKMRPDTVGALRLESETYYQSSAVTELTGQIEEAVTVRHANVLISGTTSMATLTVDDAFVQQSSDGDLTVTTATLVGGEFVQNGTMTVTAGMSSSASVTQNGTLNISGDLDFPSSTGSFTQNGTMTVTGNVSVRGAFAQNGTMSVTGGVSVASGTFTQNAALNLGGELSMYPSTTACYVQNSPGWPVTVPNGDFIVDGWKFVANVPQSWNSIHVLNGGVITADVENMLSLTATGVVEVDAASRIDVSYTGTLPTSEVTAFAGGSHGGAGGTNDISSTNATYGDYKMPQALGTGGANDDGNRGGGAVKLVAGALELNGKILANGWSDYYSSGGGSGGSVWLNVGTLAGAGSVQANGGDGSMLLDAGGGGGGGRVAVYYDALGSATSPPFDFSAIQASGGRRGLYSSFQHGGAGTIYVKMNSEPSGELRIDNGEQEAEYSAPTTLDGITEALTLINANVVLSGISNVATLTATDSNIEQTGDLTVGTLELAGGSFTQNGTVTATTVTSSGAAYAANGALSVGALTLSGGAFEQNASLNVTGALSVSAGVVYTNNSGWPVAVPNNDFVVDGWTLVANVPQNWNSIRVINGGVITTDPGNPLSITAALVEVDGTSSIDVTGRGAPPLPEVSEGSGGSYGGPGVVYADGTTNATYGDYRAPSALGTGGRGSAENPDSVGGGALKVVTDAFVLNGSLLANGASDVGGGSGGSIWLDVGTLSGLGSAQANGGTGGGGGRIAVYYDALGSATAEPFDLNNAQATGGGHYEGRGGAGTIYTKNNSEPLGHVRIDNSGGYHNGDSATTRLDVLPEPLTVTTANVALSGIWDIPGLVATNSNIEQTGDLTVPNLALTGGTFAQNGTVTVTTLTNNDVAYAANNTLSVETLTLSGGSFQQNATLNVTGALSLSSGVVYTNNTGWPVAVPNDDFVVDGWTLVANIPQQWNSIQVINGGAITTDAGNTLSLTATSVEVDGTSKIDVSGKGTAPTAVVTGRSGGSHGGLGSLYVYGGTTNAAHGDYLAPADLGTGGRSYSGDYDTVGGGAVKLVADALTLDGQILANGTTATYYSASAGGGSGGSVWLDAGTFSGTGSVQANGGNGTYYGGGGGGGGRVAVYYDGLGATAPFDLNSLQAAGGLGSDSTPNGEDGTVYTEDRQSSVVVLGISPSGMTNQPVASLRVDFEGTIDPASFTADDVAIAGPAGPATVSGITAIDAITYAVNLDPPLSADGDYTVAIGPQITTASGAGMDQDGDGTTGDVYSGGFTLDLTPPATPIIDSHPVAPEINAVTSTSITLSGTREDNSAVWVDGVEKVALGTGPWQIPLELSQGSSTLSVHSTDAAGNASIPVEVNFIVDSVAPVINGMSPADGTFSATIPADIRLAVVEEGSGLDLAASTLGVTRNSAAVAGNWAEQAGELIFTPDTALTEGSYAITAQLIDLAGLSSVNFSGGFVLDTTAPAAPNITSHPTAPEVNAVTIGTVTLSGTREADSAIWVDGAEKVALGSELSWQTSVDLPEGNSTLSVHATDATGNTSEVVEVNFVVDSVAPAFTGIMYPADGSFTKTAPAEIRLGIVEDGSGVDIPASTLTVTRDAVAVGGSWAELPGELVFSPASALAEGGYSVSAQLVDNAGLSSAVFSGAFTLDQTPPEAPGIDPLPDVTTVSTQTVAGSRAANTGVWFGGAEVVALSAETTWSFDAPLAEGDNTLSFTLRDRAGNESQPATASIYYDNTAPLAVSVNGNGAGDGTSVALDWSGYDEVAAGNDIESYLVYRSTVTFTQVSEATLVATLPAGSKTYSDTGLVRNQSYFFAVAARDTLGNMLSDVTPIQVTPADVIAPEEVSGLQVQSLADALILSWSAPADSAGDLAGYTVYFNNDGGTPLDAATTSHTVNGLSAATGYPVRITTRDGDGNESTGVTTTGVTLLTNPGGLGAEPFDGKVALTWAALADETYVDHYALYAADSDFQTVAGMSPRATVPSGQVAGEVAGLTNDANYFFAVTAVNSSGGQTDAVSTVSARPTADHTGPNITDVQYGGAPLTEGATLTESATVSVRTDDPSGVSRVVFTLDKGAAEQIVLGTDAAGAGGVYTTEWDLPQSTEGAHTLTIEAHDSLDNMSTVALSVTVAVAPPPAPSISQPNDGLTTNEAEVTIAGSAEPGSTIHLYNNAAEVGSVVSADANGSFTAVVALSEGANQLQAAAENRGGLGPLSAAVAVTLDSTIPNAPTGVAARALEGGPVELSWNRSLDSAVVGYDIYRGTEPFTALDQAVKANSSQLTGTTYEDLPPTDGTYYYRVVSANELGTLSALSVQVSAASDSTLPRALSIDYQPQGNQDPTTGAIGPGWVKVTVTVNEPLLTTPFLSLTPEGGVPISLTLTQVGDSQYESGFDITETTPTGTAYAVFSARDRVGNRGTEIDAGATLGIDTDGPATTMTVLPGEPIKNDPLNPVTVHVTLTLDEPHALGGAPSLEYLLSGVGRTAIPVDNLVQSAALEWKGSLTLPADAGAAEVESLTFSYQGIDAIGNVSGTINGDGTFQVYQGALPPLAVPDGLSGHALPGGQVQLAWNPVEEAVEYQIYRQGPGETEPTLYQRAATAEFTDTTAMEGDYLYTVASVRQENGDEALSSQSEPVTVTADATAPGRPTELALNLGGSGIEASWMAPAGGETPTYSLYRAGAEITSVAGLTPLKSGVAELTTVDTAPSESDHYYAVTSVDAAGNESVPSTSVYLNFDLLPVASLTVELSDDGNPLVSWTHNGTTVAGYDLYLGDGQSLKLNDALLTGTSYEDTGYDGGDRTYTVVAIDTNGVASVGRTVTLPRLSAALSENSQVKRGLFNRLEYSIRGDSSQAVENIRMVADIGGRTHRSEPFDLAPGESRTVSVVVGGYADLTDVSQLISTIEISPASGEFVRRVSSADVLIGDGALVAGLTTNDLVRGGAGQVRLTLENTSEVETEIVTATASGQQPSNEVRFKLVDGDGNVLSTVSLQEDVGVDLVRLANGSTVARMPAGEVYTSDWITLPVPASAPDEVGVVLEVDGLHYHSGHSDALTVAGLRSERGAALVDTPYRGTVDSITPNASFGDVPVVIVGRALDRQTEQPLASQPLNLVIRSKGFERSVDVYTDGSGSYSYSFTPLAGEAGIYTVSCVHPDVLDRPEQGEFVINRVLVSPTRIDMGIPRNYEQPVKLSVSTSEGTTATNLRLIWEASDQPGGTFPDGVSVSFDPAISLGSAAAGKLGLTVVADNSADESETLMFKVLSDETGNTPLATVRVDARFSEALPTLAYTPTFVDTGVVQGSHVAEVVTLENQGLADMYDVEVKLLSQDGSPAPGWAYLTDGGQIGRIAIGEKVPVTIVAAPGGTEPDGDYLLKLQVSSKNHPTREITVHVALTQSGEGNALFHVSDIYTGTEDADKQLIPGVGGARIYVQNERVLSEEHTLTTDASGEAEFVNLPAGWYRFRASASNHEETVGRFQVKPGVTATREVFLSYNLVSVEWSVTEITIEDKYEITLNATYETQVPAPVVVAEPASINLPEMAPGDVFYGEFTLNNYGLVRADNLQVVLPQSDEFVRYELMDGVPDSLGAEERITIAYRAVALKSFEPTGETGGGCGTYSSCVQVKYDYECAAGVRDSGTARFCFLYTYGECSSDPASAGTGGSIWYAGGYGGGYGGYTSSYQSIPGAQCIPKPPKCPLCDPFEHSGGL